MQTEQDSKRSLRVCKFASLRVGHLTLSLPCHIIQAMSLPTVPKRPLTVTLTLWGVFLLGVWNVGRSIAWGRQSHILLALGATPDPRLQLIIAVVWGLVFLGLALALWQRRPFVRRAVPISLTLYAVYRFSLLHFFAQVPLNRQGWLLLLLVYLAAIVWAHWTLNRAGTKAYFEIGE